MNLYERLTAELAAAIRGGELAGGSALPPVREFARLRGIGPSTAARVYASLRQQGLVIGEVGRGTFVREQPMDAGPLSAAPGTRHWAAAPWRWRRRTCAPRSRRSPPSLTWRS
ncbi:GntR family transcriptional regulator [Achromobacter xylosoxidans]